MPCTLPNCRLKGDVYELLKANAVAFFDSCFLKKTNLLVRKREKSHSMSIFFLQTTLKDHYERDVEKPQDLSLGFVVNNIENFKYLV